MNWKISTIVVGVDGSDTSLRASAKAASLARANGARLLLVTVVRPPEGWWGIGGAPPPPEALAAALTEGRREVLADAESKLDLAGIDYETIEELGEPATRLMAVCEQQGADLLVIGRRGAGLFERVILGSVADRICHLCTCPVLVVP